MWMTLLSWVTGPLFGSVLSSGLDAYKAKLAAGNTHEKIEADLAGRELLVEARELELQSQLKTAQIGHWFEPEHLFGYTLVLYVAKVLLWDAAFHLGSTDAVRGDVSVWASWIMGFYVGTRGVISIARVLKS